LSCHFSLELNEQLVYGDRVSSGNSHCLHFTSALRLDDVLHFHGFQNAELLAVFHDVTNLDSHGDDFTGHGGHDGLGRIYHNLLSHEALVLELVGIVDQSVNTASLVGELVLKVVPRGLQLDPETIRVSFEVHEGVVVEDVVLDVVGTGLVVAEVSDDQRAVSSTGSGPVLVALERHDRGVNGRVDFVVGFGEEVVLGTSVFHHESSDSDNLFILAFESVACKTIRVVGGDETGVIVALSEGFVGED